MSLQEKIMKYMQTKAKRPMSQEDLLYALALEADEIKQLPSAMEELERKNLLIQNRSGLFGLPKHMNGDIGERGQISIEFKKQLEEMIEGINVILVDERLTTVVAENQLLFADVSRKKRKQVIDKMAAVAILQGYLDRG